MKRWIKGIIIISGINILMIPMMFIMYGWDIQFDSSHPNKQDKIQVDDHSSINTVQNWSYNFWFFYIFYLLVLLGVDTITLAVVISSKKNGTNENSISYRLADHFHDFFENGLEEKQNRRIAMDSIIQYREFFEKLGAKAVINEVERSQNEHIRANQMIRRYDMAKFHQTFLELFRKYYADKYEEIGIKA